jgi:hypothetical protein
MHLLHADEFRFYPASVFTTISRFFEYFFEISRLFRRFEESRYCIADISSGLNFGVSTARNVQFGNMSHVSRTFPENAYCKSQIFHGASVLSIVSHRTGD